MRLYLRKHAHFIYLNMTHIDLNRRYKVNWKVEITILIIWGLGEGFCRSAPYFLEKIKLKIKFEIRYFVSPVNRYLWYKVSRSYRGLQNRYLGVWKEKVRFRPEVRWHNYAIYSLLMDLCTVKWENQMEFSKSIWMHFLKSFRVHIPSLSLSLCLSYSTFLVSA